MDRILELRWIIVAVVLVVVALAAMVMRNAPSKAPDVDYYAAKANAPYTPSPERDFLQDGSVVAEVPVAIVPDNKEPVSVPVQGDDDGLVIGSLAGTLKAQGRGFASNQRYPLMYTCHQANQSPSLEWSGAPGKTKSYVVLFEKVEEKGPNPLQWSIYNISKSTEIIPPLLPRDAVIEDVGMQGMNHTGNIGYSGPCISRGQYAFRFRVFALDAELPLQGGAGKADLFKAMNGHIIDMAIIPVNYFYKY